MQVKASQSPPLQWYLEGYLALYQPLPIQALHGLILSGLQWQTFGEPHQVHALGLNSQQRPAELLPWLSGLWCSGQLRFAEFGMRGQAQFSDGPVWLPWRRNQTLTLVDLAHLDWEDGVRYQLVGALSPSARS